jgi:hypothetical protein
MGTTGLQLIADVSQKMSFAPQFEITNSITAELTRIERARGFLDAAKLSADWIAGMQKRALVRELVAGELLFRPRFLRIPRPATILQCAIWSFCSST